MLRNQFYQYIFEHYSLYEKEIKSNNFNKIT